MHDNLAGLWDVMQSYNMKTLSITPFCRDVFRVETTEGSKALKICDRDEGKLIFIYSIMRHVWDEGFTKLSKPIASSDGKACVVKGDTVYFLADWVDGKQCDFGILNDLQAACATLAQFHNVSYSNKAICDARVRCMSDRWLTTIAERLDELYSFKEMAGQQNTLFAKKYLDSYEYFIGLSENANEILLNSQYLKIADKAVQKGFFTHRDVAGRNFIMVGKEAYLIDFDYARYDIRVADVVRILERSLKLHQWSPKVGELIIDTYNNNSQQPLCKEEYKVILAFLTWPQKYWRLCNRYFKGKRYWEEESYVRKLKSMVKKAYLQEGFVEWFAQQYC